LLLRARVGHGDLALVLDPVESKGEAVVVAERNAALRGVLKEGEHAATSGVESGLNGGLALRRARARDGGVNVVEDIATVGEIERVVLQLLDAEVRAIVASADVRQSIERRYEVVVIEARRALDVGVEGEERVSALHEATEARLAGLVEHTVVPLLDLREVEDAHIIADRGVGAGAVVGRRGNVGAHSDVLRRGGVGSSIGNIDENDGAVLLRLRLRLVVLALGLVDGNHSLLVGQRAELVVDLGANQTSPTQTGEDWTLSELSGTFELLTQASGVAGSIELVLRQLVVGQRGGEAGDVAEEVRAEAALFVFEAEHTRHEQSFAEVGSGTAVRDVTQTRAVGSELLQRLVETRHAVAAAEEANSSGAKGVRVREAVVEVRGRAQLSFAVEGRDRIVALSGLHLEAGVGFVLSIDGSKGFFDFGQGRVVGDVGSLILEGLLQLLCRGMDTVELGRGGGAYRSETGNEEDEDAR